MKKIIGFAALMLVSFAIITTACKKDENTCTTTGLTYNKDIKTLMPGCAISGCHDVDSDDGSLANYSDVKAFIISGDVVKSVKHASGVDPMPKGGAKWDDCKISQLEAWIAAGMPEQ